MLFLSNITVDVITCNDNTLPLVITRNTMRVSGHLGNIVITQNVKWMRLHQIKIFKIKTHVV